MGHPVAASLPQVRGSCSPCGQPQRWPAHHCGRQHSRLAPLERSVVKLLRGIGRGLNTTGHRPGGECEVSAPPHNKVSYVAWYVNRDGVPARSGPGLGFAPVGQLFYLDRGIKLREVNGWVQLRLRYRSASGLPAGATVWLPAACTNPCTPPLGH